ncbi:MAG TPA: hypothetical protein VGN57_19060 [Pirellulaceae bacterium]|jgi:uncharacterized membrane protein|nr:hypothetical protein [Pirellulaceae bacterium]
MSINDPVGQQLPDVPETDGSRINHAVKALDRHRPAIHRWFWKGLLAFNLILASLTFWFSVIPSLL